MSRLLAIATVLTLWGCGGQDALITDPGSDAVATSGALSWTQFLSRVYQVPGQDVFVVNGDSSVEGWKNLHDFYELAVLGEQQLIIDHNGGVDSKWSDAEKLNLTYCVSDAFGAHKPAVVQAMADAAAAWSAATNVRYVYQPSEDGTCSTGNNTLVFNVQPVNVNGQFLARSFFPGQSRSTRSVDIDDTSFQQTGNPTLTGILRHELGHTLGFRHEHTRPEAGTCFEDNNWRALTTYDSASVMHYPQCNGTGDWTLELTARDIAGAQQIYGAPGGGPAPTPTPAPAPGPAPTVQSWSATVAKGAWATLPPVTVAPGSTFSVVLSGSGDADLYVRFGAAPNANHFTCRPYLDTANERCVLTVPAGVTTAYVAVNGYTAATFSAKISFTPN